MKPQVDINLLLTFKAEFLKQFNTTRLHKFTNDSVGFAQIALKNSNFTTYRIVNSCNMLITLMAEANYVKNRRAWIVIPKTYFY